MSGQWVGAGGRGPGGEGGPLMVSDAVEISDPIVYNALLEATNMTTTALVNDRDDAMDKCIHYERGKEDRERGRVGKPRMKAGMSRAFLADGYRMSCKQGNISFIKPFLGHRAPRYMGVDVTRAIEMGKERVEEALSDLSAAEARLGAATEGEERTRGESSGIQRSLDDAGRSLSSARGRLSRLEQELEGLVQSNEVNVEEDLVDLETELASLTEEEKRSQGSHDEAKEASAEAHRVAEPLAARLQTIDAECAALEATVVETTRFLEEASRQSAEMRAKAVRSKRLTEVLQQRLVESARLFYTKIAERDDMDRKASTYCGSDTPVDVKMQTGALEKKILGLHSRIEREAAKHEREGNESEQDLMFKYEAATKRYEMKKQEASNVRGNIDRLQNMLRGRSKKYRAWRKKIGETTSYVFNDTLSKSGYAGSAKFDHTTQNMTMKVRARGGWGSIEAAGAALRRLGLLVERVWGRRWDCGLVDYEARGKARARMYRTLRCVCKHCIQSILTSFSPALYLQMTSFPLLFSALLPAPPASTCPQVVVDHESTSRKVSDTKILSGGERSYTTLALLLAIGNSVQSPFRAMDEFDIFMDEKHRANTLRALHDQALENPSLQHTQFLFITPNDLSTITPEKGIIEVKCLLPPQRGVRGVGGGRAGGGRAGARGGASTSSAPQGGAGGGADVS